MKNIVMIVVFGIAFLTTGIMIILIDQSQHFAIKEALQPFLPTICGIHLMCWMISGMVANYLWDLFSKGGGLAEFRYEKVFLPILVAPIVFFGIWSMWKDSSKISFALNLIAFQNGFFWQVILSKAGPVLTRPLDTDRG